ncbi:MAG: dihydroneopterin aldolase [Acidobacteria bacterium]|nr:dihydroneopterin aldolase [Acidobacteriota bacterium]
MADKILLIGIKFHGFHGLTRLERKIGVRYRVDVELSLDLTASMKSDRVGSTVDYRKVHDLIVEIGRGESYRLIETLAGKIAYGLLARFPIEEAKIRLLKETPVLDGIVEGVGVELTRCRPVRKRKK